MNRKAFLLLVLGFVSVCGVVLYYQNHTQTEIHDVTVLAHEREVGGGLVLLTYNRTVTTDESLEEIARRGLTPADDKELEDFSKSYPVVEGDHIVALGRRFPGRVSSVACYEGDHFLGRHPFFLQNGWGPGIEFLAVRKRTT